MTVDNAQLAQFCNASLRPTLDRLGAAYYAAKQTCADFDATGIAALLPSDPQFNNWIDDGSATDGRPPVSSGGVSLIVANLKAFIAQVESTNTQEGLSLIAGVLSVSPRYNKLT